MTDKNNEKQQILIQITDINIETIKDQFSTHLDRKMEKVDLSQIYLDNQ